MKIKMKTTARGPNTETNWNAGDIRDVAPAVARGLIAAGYAEAMDPFPSAAPDPAPEPESAPEEQAVNPAPAEAEQAVSRRPGKKRGR